MINFLPSWLQDFSGANARMHLMEVVNSSLFPLAVLIAIAIVAFLLIDRTGSHNQPTDPRGGSGSVRRRKGRRITDSPGAVPLSTPQAPATPTAMPPVPQPNAPLVVIADDSRLVRIKLSRLLTAAGFRVAEAANGQEALEIVQRGELPSVLITDLDMPSMDGFELIAAVHGAFETEHMPIIAITGNEDLQARVGDLSGVYGIFRKPWNDRALIRRVRALSVVAYAH